MSLALLFCSCLLAQQASIQGVAIDAVTRQPMAGVHITLRAGPAIGAEREDAETYGAMTRPDGRFSIADLKPGIYVLIAQHNGYVQLPGKEPGGRTITLKPGEVVPDVTVELTQHAVIIGHVLDEFGDPVQYVQVSVESGGNSWRKSRPEVARTDDRGQFRIPLPPGKYYVQALADPLRHPAMMGGVPEIRTDGAVPPVYGATFYPSAATSDKATPIELVAGQTVSGIDIHLAPKRSVTIRGTATGMPTNTFGAPAYIMLRTVNSGAEGHGSISQPAFSQPDGTFTITGLTSGKYRLTARFEIADGASLQSASAEVDAETDESSVVLALAHGEKLSGTVEIEEDMSKPATREKLGIRLSPEIQLGANKGADVDDSGVFHIDGVFPGKVRVTVMPLPENAYVKAIKAGAAEAQDGMVDLSHGVAGAAIHITLSRNGGRVEGRVLGDDGQPFAGASIVLLEESADPLDEKGIKPTEPGEKFSYSGLHPGKYRIMALDPGQFMGSHDGPDALRALLAHAEEIEIHEGDRISKDIKIGATQ